jgi:hypothetical protein
MSKLQEFYKSVREFKAAEAFLPGVSPHCSPAINGGKLANRKREKIHFLIE